MSELHSLIRIIHVPENLKCRKDAYLLRTYISTRLQQLPIPTIQNSTSDPQIMSPINSVTYRTLCQSRRPCTRGDQTKITIDPLHTEVTD